MPYLHSPFYRRSKRLRTKLQDVGPACYFILTMTPHRSGLEPAALLNILTGLLLAKLSIPSSLAKYLRTVLPWPITAENHKENQVRDNLNKHNVLRSHFLATSSPSLKDISTNYDHGILQSLLEPTCKKGLHLLLHSGSAHCRWSDILACD